MGAAVPARRRTGGAARVLIAASRMLLKAELVLAVLAVAIMLVIVLREIIGRSFFTAPTTWVNEYAGYLVAAVTFLGAAYAFRTDALLRVTLLTERLSPRTQAILHSVVTGLSLLAVVVLTYYATTYYLVTLTEVRRANSPQAIPLAIPRAPMIIGMYVLCLELLRSLLAPDEDEGREPDAADVPEAI